MYTYTHHSSFLIYVKASSQDCVGVYKLCSADSSLTLPVALLFYLILREALHCYCFIEFGIIKLFPA